MVFSLTEKQVLKVKNEKCFAIIGTTTHQKIIISVSHWIPWLQRLGVKVNLAHYNPNEEIITVVKQVK